MYSKSLDIPKEELDRMIEDTEKDLKALTKRRRRDFGTTRTKYNQSLPPKYRSYLMRANQKGIKFELSVEEFELITSSLCYYCGASSKIGVDRIDSGEGYTLENARPSCPTCNMMKYTHSEELFRKQIKRIHDYLGL